MKRFIAIFMMAAFLAPALLAQTYNVDAAKSTLGWTGEKVTGAHNGTVAISSGMMKMDDENALSGEFAIDMTSINCLDIESEEYNGKLVGHLKSDDFFSVASHPTSTFEITRAIEFEGDGANHRVFGKLTIKGITNEISFPAQIDFTDAGFTAKANFTIDRSKWNVKYGSGSFFDALGDKLIYDDIKFNLNLTGSKG